MELDELTTEELKEIALEKSKRGIATKRAFQAQQIIWSRAGCPYQRNYFNNDHKKYTSSNYGYLS